jgi:hypothetical protein
MRQPVSLLFSEHPLVALFCSGMDLTLSKHTRGFGDDICVLPLRALSLSLTRVPLRMKMAGARIRPALSLLQEGRTATSG